MPRNTQKGEEVVPKNDGSLGVEVSSTRSDRSNPMFPAVSVSPSFGCQSSRQKGEMTGSDRRI